MIEATRLTFSYKEGPQFYFPDFKCRAEEQWLVLGESGSGKTTFLHLLAGLRTPAGGQVKVKGIDLQDVSSGSIDQFRGKHIGLVFQTPHFLQALTIRQNLALAQKLAGNPVDYSKVDALLDRLGIGHRGKALPRHCSQGEQQRASIGRAVINQPAILLADEPTSALDDKHCFEVLALLDEHSRSGKSALIIVTHDQRLKGRISKSITLSTHE